MKYIFLLITIFLASHFQMEAQRVRPTLEIVLSDNNPFQITVNGRIFRNVNNKLALKDLPARNNEIEIIRYCTPEDGERCKKKTVFRGRVPMKYNKNYQAVVLVGEGTLRVADDGTLLAAHDLSNANGERNAVTSRPQPNTSIPLKSNNENSEFLETVQLKNEANKQLQDLGTELKSMDNDVNRVKRAIHYLKSRNRNNTVDDLKVISSWIMFDENKLDFVKQAVGYVNNPSEYQSLVKIFTMKEYADSFMKFLENN